MKRCEACGWSGPREEREVNFCSEWHMWLCSLCFGVPAGEPTQITCQDCGAVGLESATDLMPNTCPNCFERRVLPIFMGYPHTYRNVPALIGGLIEAGCKPLPIRVYITAWARRVGLQ